MPGVIVARGNTYEHRDVLRQLGARWDPVRKAWVLATAGMARTPHHDGRPRVEAVQRAIDEGRLRGVYIEWCE